MTRQRLLPLPIPEDPVILTLMEKRDAEKREGNFGKAEKLDQRNLQAPSRCLAGEVRKEEEGGMTSFSLRTCAGIVNALRTAEGGIVSRNELIETLRPDPDDEPAHPESYIDQNLWTLRHVFGFPIVTEHGRGLRFAPGDGA